MLMYPKANIPIIALSIHSSLDPQLHINIGKILRPLREQNILFIGSGSSFHNFGYFRAKNEKYLEGIQHSHTWSNYLSNLLTNTETSTDSKYTALINWTKGPSATAAHPIGQEDHLIPLHVIAGLAGDSICHKVGYNYPISEISMVNFEWK